MIIEEVEDVAERFGDDRRTELVGAVEGISTEDLIVEEDMVVTVSNSGYIKRNPLTQYRAQRRGGKGVKGMDAKDADFVENGSSSRRPTRSSCSLRRVAACIG